MKLNKKGYTLIELLAVILIIGLVLGFSTYGIIKAIKSSKEKVTTLSEKSIKEAAETFAAEKNDDNNYWLDITDKENKYFCITIEGFINTIFSRTILIGLVGSASHVFIFLYCLINTPHYYCIEMNI